MDASSADSPSVLVSPTNEYGKIAVALNGIKLHGRSDVVTGINVAQVRESMSMHTVKY